MDHIRIGLTGVANLALTSENKGRCNEAEELDVQVMDTTKRVLGPEHPDTLTSVNNLSFTCKAMRKQAEALIRIDECIQLSKLVLRVDHPLLFPLLRR